MIDEIRSGVGVIGLSNVLLDVEELGVADQSLELLSLAGVGRGGVLRATQTVVLRAESRKFWLGGLGGLGWWLIRARCAAVLMRIEWSGGG